MKMKDILAKATNLENDSDAAAELKTKFEAYRKAIEEVDVEDIPDKDILDFVCKIDPNNPEFSVSSVEKVIKYQRIGEGNSVTLAKIDSKDFDDFINFMEKRYSYRVYWATILRDGTYELYYNAVDEEHISIENFDLLKKHIQLAGLNNVELKFAE